MLRDYFVCKNCEFGPCYCSSPMDKSFDICGQISDPTFPTNCLYEENPNWKFIKKPSVTNKFCNDCYEWFCGDGYDRCPEWLQNLVNGDGGMAINVFTGKIVEVLNFIDGYESNYWEREGLLKDLKKITKEDLISAIFPQAFTAGLIFSEMERLRRSEGGEENITLDKEKLYD